MIGLGGLIGDMVGEPYEFLSHMKTTDFSFLSKEHNTYTDDSVMTLAVLEGILDAGIKNDILVIKDSIQKSMRKWGRKYNRAGYGGSFMKWLESEEPQPYNSWGNGSAMRVGTIPFLYMNDLKRCLEIAAIQAEITHNHPEGIKGAVSIAHTTWLALRGVSKEEIWEIISDDYYPLEESCDSIREWYRFDVSCQGTCPVAIQCFLESSDYESAVRLAVSMGGDSDTLACITGTIAEAYYGVPLRFQKTAMEILPEDLKGIARRFDEFVKDSLGAVAKEIY